VPGSQHLDADTQAAESQRLATEETELGAPLHPQPRDFPTDLPRYRYLGFLGEGGMGQVFQAHDERLQRTVALKFVRTADPDLARRLLREAAAQALIDHPHICKVFDVGEVHGRPYVAMQYIAGETLARCAPDLNLAQKVRLVQQAAEAMHAAHRHGLVHRDLKPGNILVETSEDGQLHPYVVDFGLARDARASDQTQLGAIQGTPQYMAPEQARGEATDRRSDVYSLGATLYALLAGRPPFAGTSSVQVLVQVAHEDAPPLANWLPTVPRDLQTVVMKCLEREPQRRYDSARALAEDLGRYLDGEPVLAQADRLGYRLRKKLRKHKVLAAVVAGAVVLLALALGLAWQARREAEEVAAIAQHFTRQSEEIAVRMRMAWLLPAHDLSSDRAKVRKRLTSLRADMERLGPHAQGPGYFALGQAQLAIQDDEGALQDLTAAWQHGQRGTEVAHALGMVWTALYERMKDDSGRWQAPELRGVTDKQARAEAMRWLRMVPPEQGTALEIATLDSLQDRFEPALERLRQATQRDPLAFEAWTLLGRILSKQGHKAAEAGQFHAAARLYGQATEALGQGVEIARSHPEPHQQLCRALYRSVELPAALTETRARMRAAGEACSRAVKVDPDDDRGHGKLAGLYTLEAQLDLQQGQAPTHLELAEREARQALALAPLVAGRARALADVLRLRGLAAVAQGRDGTPAFAEALDVLAQALAHKPEPGRLYRVLLSQGEVHLARAQAAQQDGQDPREALAAALAALEAARKLAPHDHPALPVIIEASLLHAQYAWTRHEPMDVDLARIGEVLAVLGPVADQDPDVLVLRAKTLQLQARVSGQGIAGQDEQAVALTRQALALRPGWLPAQVEQGLACLHAAARARGRMQPWAQWQQCADQALAQAQVQGATSASVRQLHAWVALDGALQVEPPRADLLAEAQLEVDALGAVTPRAPEVLVLQDILRHVGRK
jgi:tetratricopeptide (TPR) repeat protein/predicted Ser/Thr protein kinase